MQADLDKLESEESGTPGLKPSNRRKESSSRDSKQSRKSVSRRRSSCAPKDAPTLADAFGVVSRESQDPASASASEALVEEELRLRQEANNSRFGKVSTLRGALGDNLQGGLAGLTQSDVQKRPPSVSSKEKPESAGVDTDELKVGESDKDSKVSDFQPQTRSKFEPNNSFCSVRVRSSHCKPQ